MTWQVTISGHTDGPHSKETEAAVLANLRAVVEQLRGVEGNSQMSATVSTTHHGWVDLIGPRSPDAL